MPLFVDKNNERRFIWFIIILISAIVLLLFYYFFIREVKIQDGGIQYPNEHIKNTKSQLVGWRKAFKSQVDTVYKVSQEDLPRVLADSLATLEMLRQKDINRADELLKKFDHIEEMSPEEQSSLINEVYTYLFEKVNPEKYLDFGRVAKEMVTSNKFEILNIESKKNEDIIKKLNEQVNQLSKDKTTLEKLYSAAKKLLEKSTRDLALLQADTLNKGVSIKEKDLLIGSQKEQINDLSELTEKLETDMKSVNKVSVKNSTFTAPGAKSKSDGSYIVGKMSSLEFKSIVYHNIPSQTDKAESIRVVFTLPSGVAGKTIIYEEKKTVLVGQEFVVKYNNPKYKFQEGEYYVQLFHDNTSTIIPINKLSISAKKRLAN